MPSFDSSAWPAFSSPIGAHTPRIGSPLDVWPNVVGKHESGIEMPWQAAADESAQHPSGISGRDAYGPPAISAHAGWKKERLKAATTARLMRNDVKSAAPDSSAKYLFAVVLSVFVRSASPAGSFTLRVLTRALCK